MPTFESIAFSRDLVGRLVAVSENSGEETLLLPIETPQALLSRPPDSMRLMRPLVSVDNNSNNNNSRRELVDAIDPSAVNQVRKDVARALLKLSATGKRNEALHSVLQRFQEDEAEENVDQNVPATTISSATAPPCTTKFSNTVSALEYLQYEKLTARFSNHPTTDICVSTGSTALDEMLGIPQDISSPLSSTMNTLMASSSILPMQGLPWGHVIQCSGPSSSGKTQLGLQLALSAVSSQGCCSVWYGVSALGGPIRPLALRLKQLALAAAIPDGNRSKALGVLDSISFQMIHDGYQLLTYLDQLEEVLLKYKQGGNNSSHRQQQHRAGLSPLASSLGTANHPEKPSAPGIPKVLILDSASGCLTTEDETLLQTIALRLKQLARHYNLLVWVNNASMIPASKSTNNPRASTASSDMVALKPKPALGMAWKRTFDIHVSLQKSKPNNSHESSSQAKSPLSNNNCQVVRATLEQHPFQNCNSNPPVAIDFCITNKGIEDYLQPTPASDGVAED